MNGKQVVLDTESDGLRDTATVIHCAVAKDIDTGDIRKFTPDTIHLLPAYLDSVDVLIGHNIIKHDLPLIKEILGYEYKGRVWDTLVQSRVLNPTRPFPYNCPNRRASIHGLEAWGYRVGRGKPEHDDWTTYTKEMLHRCSEDVEINHLVLTALEKEMKESPDWSTAMPMTMRLFQVFNSIEEYGWKVDVDYMRTLFYQLSDMQQEIYKDASPYLPYVIEQQGVVNKPFTKAGKYNATLTKWIATHCPEYEELMAERAITGPYSRVLFRKVDLDRRNEVVSLLLDEGWEPEQWNVNSKGERTSPKMSKTDPFNGVDSDLGKLAARFIQVRHRKSLVEGLMKLVRADGRIPSVISGLADTARVKHKGIVNIPNVDAFFGPEIRKIFISDEDKVLVGVDSKGNQVRQLTSLMGDEEYEYEVLHGDIHSANQKAAGLSTRSNAKTFFYGFLFGAGDEKTGKIVGGNAADGKRLKENFLQGLPRLGALLGRLKEEWRQRATPIINKWGGQDFKDGRIRGLDGRPINIPSEHAILVYDLQSMEAIHMSYALLFAYKWLNEKYEWGKDFGIACFYHDEINTECRPEIAEDVGAIVADAIAYAGKYLNISTPHEGDIKIGQNWLEVH